MTNDTQQPAGPVIMLISGLIFGFFGFFYVNWSAPGVDGHAVLFRVLLGWTLRVSSILFLASAGITIARPVAGNLLYALVGVVGAGLFVVVAVMDVTDTRHGFMPYGPAVLLLFAAWNGYGSWMSLRSVLSMRRVAAAIGSDAAESRR